MVSKFLRSGTGFSLLSICIAAVLTSLSCPAADVPGVPPGIRQLHAPGLHNLYALGTNVFSGSTPEGERAFAALAELGVKTIITVDGAAPDLESARKHGMRYVHLPHGYDGISEERQQQLLKAALALPGPFYVHCHHGKHRGPAAAGVICRATLGWSAEQAESWLVAAGTSTNYAGLYEAVRDFRLPDRERLERADIELPEVSRVSGIVEAMVQIDERWEHLRAVRAAGYKAPPSHPDIKPANEAVILWENYREAQRLPESRERGDDFLARLRDEENRAKEAERLLRLVASAPSPDLVAQLDRTFDALGKGCASCHRAHRDRRQDSSKPVNQ